MTKLTLFVSFSSESTYILIHLSYGTKFDTKVRYLKRIIRPGGIKSQWDFDSLKRQVCFWSRALGVLLLARVLIKSKSIKLLFGICLFVCPPQNTVFSLFQIFCLWVTFIQMVLPASIPTRTRWCLGTTKVLAENKCILLETFHFDTMKPIFYISIWLVIDSLLIF